MTYRWPSKCFYLLLIFPLLWVISLIRVATYPNCLIIKQEEMHLEKNGEPVQIMCRHRKPIAIDSKDGFQKATMKFLARYRVSGKVIAVQQINDRGSWMSAADVGIAWGKMADPQVDRYMQYGQRGRFLYTFPKPGLPVSTKYLGRHISNNHILTVSNSMLNVVKNLEVGDDIVFDGYLVNLSGVDRRGRKFTWKSSLTRNDGGDGACEVMYIERIWVNGHYYQ